jgi:tetratricopeptide (TPR) repeat protein
MVNRILDVEQEPTRKPREDEAAGYLYHEQELSDLPRAKRNYASPKKPRRDSNNNMGKRYFLANMRTLALVLIGMGILLGIAWIVSGQPFNYKIAKARKQVRKQVTAIDTTMDPDILALEQALTGGGLPEPKKAETSIDIVNTDAIRKALWHARLAREALQEGKSTIFENDSQIIKDSKRAVQKKKYDQAVTHYKDALNLAPYLFKVWAELGSVYLDMEDYRRAQIALERAVQGDPSQPAVLSKLGLTYLYLDYVPKALEFFETAQEIDPTYAKTRYYSALCYIRLKDHAQARTALEDYLKLESNDPQALKEWAYLLAREGNLTGALDSIKKALSESPDSGDLYFEAAALSALLGRVDDAIRYLEKGEAFTNPARAYKVYQQPAFNKIRSSELGKIYEKELVDRTRRILRERQETN